MTVKKEYIVLAVIIVVLVLVLVLRDQDRTHYTLPELEPIEKMQITRIVVSRADSSLTLARHDEIWKIEPYGYPVDQGQVDKMLDALTGFTLTTLVSESENYVPYELDGEKRIGIEAFAGDTRIVRFDIGKPASTYRHTFVRLEDDPKIYQARENLRSVFDKQIDQIHDKVVLAVEKEYITDLTFIGAADSLALMRVEPGSSAVPPVGGDTLMAEPVSPWRTIDGRGADEKIVDGVVDRLVSLKCDSYIYGKMKDDFTDPIFTLRVNSSAPATLSVFEKRDDNKYPAVSSENDYPFLLPEWVVKQINKTPDELLGTGEGM
ncbi:MAG TPA: DUF4340 domain-containing protein [Patescibacteria group bacterium]|nr:DUF4340 domain-containing protein [Patescibacteria group bacterium]